MIGQKGVPATLGGIERHVQELATRLVRRGAAVDVYCRPHYTPKDARLEGVGLVRLPSIHTKHLDAISHTVAASTHALFSRADIVHYHALGPSSLAWLPRLGGKRTVVTVHGLDWRREKWGPVAARCLRACEWTATHCADATVVVSRTLETHFAGSGGRRVEYIPNGTVLPGPASDRYVTAQGLEPGRYLLFVGRLVPEKGLHVLLAAHALAVPERVLVVAGAGQFTDRYVERCRAAANDNVRFLGPVLGDDLASLWQNAQLVVVPSSLEGLSIALLEAMSFGRPVLASDIPENREVLDGVGESFRAGDAGDLARRLHALLAEPDRLATLGAKARARIEAEYDWERVADRTVQVYRSLLPASPGGPQKAPRRGR
ncbi:MAG: glycosyltransferase family 4 protein [Candidatus Eiseniibacteriota bacterium]